MMSKWRYHFIRAGSAPGFVMGNVLRMDIGRCLFQIVSAGVGILGE